MAAEHRNVAIPATLQPRGTRPDPKAEPTIHHLAVVVPDIRAQKFLAGHTFQVGPADTAGCEVHIHVFTQDPGHKAKQLDTWVRWAMVDSGLLAPADVGFIVPVQTQIGWTDHEANDAA